MKIFAHHHSLLVLLRIDKHLARVLFHKLHADGICLTQELATWLDTLVFRQLIHQFFEEFDYAHIY